MTATNTEIAEAIRGGVAAIEKNGWCQNAMQSGAGQLCLIGSIRSHLGLEIGTGIIMVGDPHLENIYGNALHVLNSATALTDEIGQFTYFSVVTFNDSNGRTEEEVKKFMLGVADKVEFYA